MTNAFDLKELHPDCPSQALSRIGASSINLISAVYWETDADWCLGERVSADDFIFIPISGALSISQGTKTQFLKPGYCLCLPEGASCHVQYAAGCRAMQVFAIHARLSDAAGLPLLQQLTQRVLPFDLALTEAFKSLVSIFNQDLQSGNQFGKNLIRILLSQWALSGIDLHGEHNHDSRITAALRIIHQHYQGDLQVSKIASEVKLGVVQFRKLFKQYLQQSPKLYIAHYRLRQAAQALQQHNDSIQQIAYQNGFQDEHYFHNSFKQFFHCTPTQYRQRAGLEA